MEQQQSAFDKRLEQFQKIREDIKLILSQANGPMDMAQLYIAFKLRRRYLPDLERRMRELVENGEVTKTDEPIRKYTLNK